ncbi:MAG TPA: helical backbone metal receptor [Burkholderiales bacterium]|nr:helical backbone metal receptor [Burkholderiales bacterium]
MKAGATLVDAAGTRHVPASRPRIVSLVPSITELLCDLGLAPALVGRTGFCIHPRETVRGIPKVGGTKDVDLDKIRSLAPTHVIVNVDENRKADARALAEFVPTLVVTHPLAPMDNLALYRLIGGIFGREEESENLCRGFETEYAALEAASRAFSTERALYLVWKNPWMTVSRDTYVSRMLALVGWETVPAHAVDRYPRISLDDRAIDAGIVLLSSEPYRFDETHAGELRGVFPGRTVALIDGEMTSWYGSRAIAALGYLLRFRQGLDRGRASPAT